MTPKSEKARHVLFEHTSPISDSDSVVTITEAATQVSSDALRASESSYEMDGVMSDSKTEGDQKSAENEIVPSMDMTIKMTEDKVVEEVIESTDKESANEDSELFTDMDEAIDVTENKVVEEVMRRTLKKSTKEYNVLLTDINKAMEAVETVIVSNLIEGMLIRALKEYMEEMNEKTGKTDKTDRKSDIMELNKIQSFLGEILDDDSDDVEKKEISLDSRRQPDKPYKKPKGAAKVDTRWSPPSSDGRGINVAARTRRRSLKSSGTDSSPDSGAERRR